LASRSKDSVKSVPATPTVCDNKSAREFEHKVSKQWERPRVLWRVITPNDPLAQRKSWNFDTTTQHHLGTGLQLNAHSSLIQVLGAQGTSRSSLSASYQHSPRLGRSLRPERAQNDTASRVRRLVQDWPVVGGFVAHTDGAYWEAMRGLGEMELVWK